MLSTIFSRLGLLSMVGADFQVHCGPLVVERSDPIISPGRASGHSHIVAGGTGFSRTETPSNAVAALKTTCDKSLDNSNYWVPALYHHNKINSSFPSGSYTLIPLSDVAIYYQSRACNYTANHKVCPSPMPYASVPPTGLAMVAGNPCRRTNATTFADRAIHHVCVSNGGAQSELTYEVPQRNTCDLLRAEVYFPSCWDGIIESTKTDQSSHMAYPQLDYNIGVCRQSNPIAIYSVFFEFIFDTKKIRSYPNFEFNEWVWAMNDTSGYGLHGDFMKGWKDQARLGDAMSTCAGPNPVQDGSSNPGCSFQGYLAGEKFDLFNQTGAPLPPETDPLGFTPVAKLPGAPFSC